MHEVADVRLAVVEHDLLTHLFEFENGCLQVPTGAGIGVAIDRDALAHYADLYDRVGALSGCGHGRQEQPVPSASGPVTARQTQLHN